MRMARIITVWGTIAWWFFLFIAGVFFWQASMVKPLNDAFLATSPSPLDLAAGAMIAAFLAEVIIDRWRDLREAWHARRVAQGLCARCEYPIPKDTDRCSECGLARETHPTPTGTWLALAAKLSRAASVAAVAVIITHVFLPVRYEWTSAVSSRWSGPASSPWTVEERTVYSANLRLIDTASILNDERITNRTDLHIQSTTSQTSTTIRMAMGKTDAIVEPDGISLPLESQRLHDLLAQSPLGSEMPPDVIESLAHSLARHVKFRLEQALPSV